MHPRSSPTCAACTAFGPSQQNSEPMGFADPRLRVVLLGSRPGSWLVLLGASQSSVWLQQLANTLVPGAFDAKRDHFVTDGAEEIRGRAPGGISAHGGKSGGAGVFGGGKGEEGAWKISFFRFSDMVWLLFKYCISKGAACLHHLVFFFHVLMSWPSVKTSPEFG